MLVGPFLSGTNGAYSQKKTAQSIGRSPIEGTTSPVAAITSGSANAAIHASAQPGASVHESSVKTTTSPRARSRPRRRRRGTPEPGSAASQTT
jgi:hypothetical protein